MNEINIDVWLYGSLARYGPDSRGKSYANLKVRIPVGGTMEDLLKSLALPSGERGITFVNGKLTAMPGLQPDLDQHLAENDRVAFFHLQSMWPFQYRDGVLQGQGMAGNVEEKRRIFHHRPEGIEK